MANKREKQKQGKTDNVVYLLLRKIIAGKDTEINALRDRIIQLEKEIVQLKSGKRDKTNIQPSQKIGDAAAMLGALFSKSTKHKINKKQTPKIVKSTDNPMYEQIFKKYEKMMQLGINLHGAIGRMRGFEDKAVIAAFEDKHFYNIKYDPSQFGLKPKKHIFVGKNITMQRLLWNPIDIDRIPNSLWATIDELSIHYDKQHFEAHFQIDESKSTYMEFKTKVPKIGAKKITFNFISEEWRCDVLFGLKNLNLTNNEIRQALINMDENIMTVDRLSQLLQIVPTIQQEIFMRKLFIGGTGYISDYGTVEQFFCTLYDFYNVQKRVKLWMFKQRFLEIYDFVIDSCRIIGRACDKLRNNKNLRLLLSIILAFGNHMNSKVCVYTRNGETYAYGFDIKILTHISNIKDIIILNRSLLMYIYEFCDCQYPAANNVLTELKQSVKTATLIQFETIREAYQRIQDTMMEIKSLTYCDDLNDGFIMEISRFHKAMRRKMNKLNMTVGNTKVSILRVMKKFCYGSENSPTTIIQSFYKIWNAFFEDLSAAKTNLIKLNKERFDCLICGYVRTGSLKYIPLDILQIIYEYIDYVSNIIKKGTSVYKEFRKMNVFEEFKINLHYKLSAHIKEKILFIYNGGRLDGQRHQKNATMRRLSTMYQDKIK